MALQFGFYDSLNGDRKYNAQQWSSIFDGIIRDGVFQAYGQAFNPVASGTDLSVTISSGRAWFNHTWFYSDGDINDPLTLVWDAAHQLLPEPSTTRIDAIVFRVDSRPSARTNSIQIIKGPTSGQRPIYGDAEGNLKRGEYVNDYVLAFVTVQPNMTVFTQSAIQSNIGGRVEGYPCPFVTGPLEILDDAVFWQQWDTGFHEWMNTSSASFNNWMGSEKTRFETWWDEIEHVLGPDEAAQLLLLIQRQERILYLTIPTTGWSSGGPGIDMYQQTFSVPGIKTTDNPTLVKCFDDVANTTAAHKAYNKAFDCLASGSGYINNNNYVSFLISKIPETSIKVGLKGY